MPKDWTEKNKRLREENIQISEERGRGDLEGDDQEGIKSPKITASEIKKYKRRKEQWQKKVNQRAHR